MISFIDIHTVIIGIRLQTWTQVMVNQSIGKIIARDPTLAVSRLYRMAVTLSLICGADLLGCIHRAEKTKGNGLKE